MKFKKRKRDAIPDDVSESLRVPESVFEEREEPQASGWSVGESYFSVHKPVFDPERARSGQIEDVANFINPTPHPDTGELGWWDPGTGEEVGFKFGATDHGRPERNNARGFVQARRNPKTHELDPHGEPVVLNDKQGTGKQKHLLVRRRAHADFIAAQQKHDTLGTLEAKGSDALHDALDEVRHVARKLGLSEALESETKNKELTIQPKGHN